MSEIKKYWVRIPIGSKEEHKDKYVESMMNLCPSNTVEKFEEQWKSFVKYNIIQVIVDVRTFEVLFTMSVTEYGQMWNIGVKLLQNITNIEDYNLEKVIEDELLESLEELEKMDNPVEEYNNYNKQMISKVKDFKIVKNKQNIDDILKKINNVGYDALSDSDKLFLDRYTKK